MEPKKYWYFTYSGPEFHEFFWSFDKKLYGPDIHGPHESFTEAKEEARKIVSIYRDMCTVSSWTIRAFRKQDVKEKE